MAPFRVGIVVAACVALGGCEDEAAPADPPEALRIMSLAPNVTEILFAMGLGEKVVARSAYCDYPPAARSLPVAGDATHVKVDAVTALQPTVAFMVTGRGDVARGLEARGVRAVTLDADTMPEMFEAVRTIGRVTGEEESAESLLRQIEEDLDAVRRRVAGLERPSVLFALPMTVGSARMMAAGRGTFVDELLEVAGARNAYPERADWPTVSAQQAIAMEPDVVIVQATNEWGAADRAEAIREAWANWPSIPAVARGRVHVLTQGYLTIPGPRVGEAARLLAETIHPGLAEEVEP
jgi:iron complex transport system substrate-binding protein